MISRLLLKHLRGIPLKMLTAAFVLICFNSHILLADDSPHVEPTPNLETEDKKPSQINLMPRTLGHNLSPSIYGLRSGQLSAGNFILGAGFLDHWTLATSPWIWTEYNMSNVVLKYSDEDHSRSVQLAYFKSQAIFLKRYSMETSSFWYTQRTQISDIYEVHFSWNTMYFFEEAAPFSLRREPYKDDAYQHSLTSLHVMQLSESYRAQLELGILGLNFWYPNYHFGMSLQKVSKNWLFQFGLSATGIIAYIGRGVHQVYQAYRNTQVAFTVEDMYRPAVSVHPEIQIQYFF